MTDTTKDFWIRYLGSDYFERKDMILELPFFKDLIDGTMRKDKDTEKIWEYLIKSQIAEYFNDIILVFEIEESNKEGER